MRPASPSCLATCLAALMGLGCTKTSTSRPPARKAPVFEDRFERAALGADYLDTFGGYRIEGGELLVRGARNHPLWLKRELPENAVIEVDAWSMDADGDIKVEAFGDGRSFAKEASYVSTGYVFIQGGWRNRVTALCRLDEHAPDRQVREDIRVEPGRRYHWLIARKGPSVSFYIDDRLVLSLEDPAPLSGPSHRFFAFNNWETELHFDNLVIRPHD